MPTNHSKFDNMSNLIENFYSQFFLSNKESLFEILIVHYELDVPEHPHFAAQFDNFVRKRNENKGLEWCLVH